MDAGKLFSQLMNRGESASGGILTGTAVSDSVDGSVMVQMDGSVVAQPSEDETELVVSAEEFADGSYVLPSVPYAGTLTVADSNGNELEEDEYDLDGSTLTIHALSSAPVDVSYETNVQQVLTNSDFDGDTYSLPSTTNLTVREDGAAVPYTLDGNLLTIDGIEHVTGVVEFAYTYDVSQVCSAGVNVLPNAPDEVAVFGRNSSGVDVVVTDYVLSGSTITLPDTYGAYTVDYPVSMVERWNVSDQYQQIPLEDSDDAADPETVTIGHNLQWEPSSVTSCTVDGVSTTYTLDVSNVVVDVPAITERFITLTYDSPVRMQVPASSFAVGPFTLPSVPVGSVITTMGGTVLANTVDDTQLTIDSLITDSPTYTLSYTEQVEQDVVELPCTPYVAEGQFVEIAVVNGMPTVIGASGSGDVTMTLAGDAADAAAAAEDAAAAAQAVADRVSEHFWTDTDGIHVTEVTEEEWNDSTGQSYHSGANVLISSAGQLFRNALNNLLGFVTSPTTGVAIFDGLGNAAANIVGLFTDSGLILGRGTESHAVISYNGLSLIDKEGDAYFSVSDLRDQTGVATITETFYDADRFFLLSLYPRSVVSVQVNGTDVSYKINGNAVVLDTATSAGDMTVIVYETKSADAKAYTIGTRDQSKNAGGMSYAQGVNVAASGHASHAEGEDSLASGNDSHAEGVSTVASGFISHAEGRNSVASGNNSHAQNRGTVAASSSQTALGKYNVEDANDTYAVIIGNGTNDTARSNALTIDWDGCVDSGRIIDLHVDPTNGADYDTRLVAASDGTNFSVFVRDPTSTNDITQFYLFGGGAGAKGRIMQRTSTDGGSTWRAQHGVRSPWTSLGSFTGTGNLSYSLTDYEEVMYSAKANGKLVTATVAKQLLTSSAQELWLGGGKSATNVANGGNLRAVINVSLTGCRGVNFSEGSTDRTSSTTWNVYAR